MGHGDVYTLVKDTVKIHEVIMFGGGWFMDDKKLLIIYELSPSEHDNYIF